MTVKANAWLRPGGGAALAALCLWCLCRPVLAQRTVADLLVPMPLTLDSASGHELTLTRPAPDFVELHTTGGDPFVATQPFTTTAVGPTVLTFDYVAMAAVPGFAVYVGTPWSEARMQAAAEIPPSEGWSTFSLDLFPVWNRGSAPPNRLRLDFGDTAGRVIQIRNIRLRAPNERERDASGRWAAHQAAELVRDADLRAYLKRGFPARLTRIVADADSLTITGETGGLTGEFALAEAQVWEDALHARSLARAAAIRPDASGAFTLRLPRVVDGGRDRLFSRWQIVRPGEDDTALSAARYADEVAARHDWPETKARSKKGLGGFVAQRPEAAADLDALGIDSVTVNLFLARLLRAQPSSNTITHARGGRTLHVDRAELERLDRTLLTAAKRGTLVFGILLVSKAGSWDGALGSVMQHPDCDPVATYSMANVATAGGVAHYVALLDFLAERYSRPGAPFGRIHHWIVHNEVDAGWVWTNCGEKPPVFYLDQYHKSMRLVQLVARQYDPHARAYISLTHHWTTTASHRFTPSRVLLEHLLAFSRVEGDFDWGIAFHPYPESLRDPRTWLDRKATFAYDTPQITFKNLEVLDAWVREPSQRFLGTHVRSVHLTEQGPNSPDYSARSLTEQAAAMAYVWQKVRHLDAIEGFQFHNWADNRREGGLRIGLRRFADDPDEPFGKKPVWHVYRALDTPDEAAAIAFALPVIGLRDWSEAVHRRPILRAP